MSKKVAHVIPHTHWDREWYMPYEKHHARLIALMDTLLDTLERDDQFRSFHLDGQTIILEDYLQVRPENRERLTELIRQGKIAIGPWYVLQDEFLTSSEANVRNLLIGHKDAQAYGPVAKIGYFPDSFGNMGQAPQLLRQAGIGNAVFGRGVKPTGFNNSVADSAAYESPFSEMVWRAPDGSEVLGILFANWYHNGMEIPVGDEEARAYWPERFANVERFASTPQLLFMNGCDHQPVQTDLTAALDTARRLYPDYEFRISTFSEYVAAVEQSIDKPLTVVEGELRSQRTDGWGTLVNTASARVYVKQANVKGQALLEKIAEPSAAFSALLGREYPRPLLDYAWKTLMQNHPHDSICGCSVDEVHAEMMTRFAKSRHVAEALAQESGRFLAGRTDTSAFAGRSAVPFVVMNYAGRERSGAAVVELEIAKEPLGYDRSAEIYEELERLDIVGGVIVDERLQPVAADIEDLGVKFGYALPDDRFRQPYMARRIKVTLKAEQVPGMGHRAYAWLPASEGMRLPAAIPPADELGNEYFSIVVQSNGSLTLMDKETGAVYENLCVYENVGDIGNEYVFKQDGDNRILTTRDLTAETRIVSATAVATIVEIVHRWEIPAEADASLQSERAKIVPVSRRVAGRSERTVPLVIVTRVTIEQGSRALKITASFDNQAKDHRLRALLPSGIASDIHYVDSVFEIAERPNEPAAEWINPSNAQHQQAFVALDVEACGLAVANIGLNEYEILGDDRRTIAVTLLRAVGELGDWGVFPTPEAQCQGSQSVEFAIIPYGGRNDRCEAAAEAYAFQTPWTAEQTEVHAGDLPPVHGWLDWSGEQLALSAVKGGELPGQYVVRWYNLSGSATELVLRPDSGRPLLGDNGKSPTGWCFSNILEQPLHELEADSDGVVRLPVKPREIVTLLWSPPVV